MKRILKKAGILLLVFLLGTAGTALLLNSESTDNRSDFNDAVFPEVMEVKSLKIRTLRIL